MFYTHTRNHIPTRITIRFIHLDLLRLIYFNRKCFHNFKNTSVGQYDFWPSDPATPFFSIIYDYELYQWNHSARFWIFEVCVMSIISYELRLCSLCFCDYFVTTWQLHDTDNKKFICADSESLALLRQLQSDVEPIVAQSCEVALSMLDFEQNGKSFEVSCCKPCSKYLHVHMNIV